MFITSYSPQDISKQGWSWFFINYSQTGMSSSDALELQTSWCKHICKPWWVHTQENKVLAWTGQFLVWDSKPGSSFRLSDSLWWFLAQSTFHCLQHPVHLYHYLEQTHFQKSPGNFQSGAFIPCSGCLKCPVSILSFSTVVCQRHNMILKQFPSVHLAYFP